MLYDEQFLSERSHEHEICSAYKSINPFPSSNPDWVSAPECLRGIAAHPPAIAKGSATHDANHSSSARPHG